MEKKDLLFEGKAKKIYETEDTNLVVIEYKDSVTAFKGEKKGKIKNKGSINNKISTLIFKYLESYNIPTHLVKTLSDTEMLTKKLEIVKIEVVMRNIAAGTICDRFKIEEGTELSPPILEFYYKNDELSDPLMNQYHAYTMDVATMEEIKDITKYALKVNAVLKSFFLRRKLKLVDFKLEFGRHDGQILLGDEITPDTCRLWDLETNNKMDKDRFRFDLGGVDKAYKEVLERVSE